MNGLQRIYNLDDERKRFLLFSRNADNRRDTLDTQVSKQIRDQIDVHDWLFTFHIWWRRSKR